MKIKVTDLGKGTLKDTNGTIYTVDGESIIDNNGNTNYEISDYDKYDNVIEIVKL